jgi:hypothetical protein
MYLTKPAGVFVQLLIAAPLTIGGVLAIVAGSFGGGAVALGLGLGAFWLGRQTIKPLTKE